MLIPAFVLLFALFPSQGDPEPVERMTEEAQLMIDLRGHGESKVGPGSKNLVKRTRPIANFLREQNSQVPVRFWELEQKKIPGTHMFGKGPGMEERLAYWYKRAFFPQQARIDQG